MAVNVLLVCTGNWHRSPIAEHVFRAQLDAAGVTTVTVRSAGTVARSGHPLPPETVAVLAGRGIDASGFLTTYLDEAALSDIDIVIGAAREHRAAAVTLRPALLNRAFTLHELARISSDIEASELSGVSAEDRLMALIRLAAGRRTHSLPTDPAADDLADPIGQPYAAFERCAATVESLVSAVLDPVVHRAMSD